MLEGEGFEFPDPSGTQSTFFFFFRAGEAGSSAGVFFLFFFSFFSLSFLSEGKKRSFLSNKISTLMGHLQETHDSSQLLHHGDGVRIPSSCQAPFFLSVNHTMWPQY